MRRKSFVIPFAVLLLVFGNTVLVAERPCLSIQATSYTQVAGFEVGLSASSALELNKTYGGTGSDFALALVQTTDGGYALAGRTYSFGAGGSDFWLVKTDAFGNMMWNRTYGGTGDDRAAALIQTVDGGYALAGTTYSFGAGSSDIWLVKTDSAGNMLWNKTYGGAREDDPAHFVVQTVDGGYTLAGRTYSFGTFGSNIWLVKTDASGNMLWNRIFGGASLDGVFAFIQTADGGYALAGHTYSFGAGNSDFWSIKTDSAGNMSWNKTYGGTSDDWAYALVQTVDGGYALIGETLSFGAGGSDVWLVRTDAFGNHLWNRTYGGTGDDGIFAFVQTVDGGYALAGHTYSFGAGNCDAWLVKTSADGSHEWNETYGGIDEDYACRLVSTDDDGYVLTGSTKSFGAGSDDFWLFKTRGQESTIIVPDDYLTIQEAINGASNGDTIFVRSGIYCEHVVVNKTVSLVGENVSATIVDGGGSGNVFTIDRNDVSIDSFTIQNSGTILGNAGLRLDNVGFCSISGNSIRGNFAGIWLEESSENLILANDITANVDDGIVFNYSHNNTISGNHIALHEYFGIVINWSNNNTICWNNITQTFGPSHGDGINLWRSSSNSIFQNQVEENNRYGIRIEVESNGNTLSDNKIGNCLTGLQVYNYSNYNDIRGNRVTNCSNGIELNRYITYTILSSNTIENSEVGININTWSVNNTISRNRLAANAAGIRFYYASLNEVFLNNITDSDMGATLQYSQNNMLYRNNLINNTQQASVSIGYANAWDSGYPDGGNYWSGYVSPDLFRGPYQNVTGGDGIGDNPYVIDIGNRDNYPFMLLSVCNVSQAPEGDLISPADEVRITAAITHLYSVERAMLNYTIANSTGTFHLSLNMTNAEGDVWNATIPAFQLETNVTYSIIGQDSEGNTISSQQQGYALEYQVIPEFSSILMLAPLAIITLLIAIASKHKTGKSSKAIDRTI